MRKAILIKIILLAVPIIVNSQNVGHIPLGYRIDWTNAGLLPINRTGGLLPETPISADNVFDVTSSVYGAIPDDGLNDYNAVNSALNDAKSASGVSIVYFPTGTYNINSTLDLSYSNGNNIVFQGESTDGTILKFAVGKDAYCFNITGTMSGDEVSLTSDLNKGGKELHGSFGSTYEVGDWIRLCENNFDVNYPNSNGIIGQITQLDGTISGGFTMKDEASKTYLTSNNLWVKEVIPITNVGIENLKVERVIDEDDDGIGYNIFIRYGVNCWVKGVEFYNAYYSQIGIYNSSHIELSGCYIYVVSLSIAPIFIVQT